MRDAAAAMAACSGPARASVTASGPGLGGAHRCAAQAAPAPGARMTLKSDVRWGPDPIAGKSARRPLWRSRAGWEWRW